MKHRFEPNPKDTDCCYDCGHVASADIHHKAVLEDENQELSTSITELERHEAESAEPLLPNFALADLDLWFRRVLEDRLKYHSTTQPDRPVGEGYTYAEIPDWELRQQRDLTRYALEGINETLPCLEAERALKWKHFESAAQLDASCRSLRELNKQLKEALGLLLGGLPVFPDADTPDIGVRPSSIHLTVGQVRTARAVLKKADESK